MGGEPTCQDRWEANPGLPLPRAWGLRLSITYINSGAQPGPICRPPPHLGSPRQPALARWWLGGVAVRGGPRSPSPHLAPPPTHAPNSCFSSFSPNLDYHPQVKKKKKSDHTRSGQLLGSAPCPRPRLPRARAASLLPPHRSYRRRQPELCGRADSRSHRAPPPSASQRESSPAPPDTGRSRPSRV